MTWNLCGMINHWMFEQYGIKIEIEVIMNSVIHTNNAPAAVGPYSQGIKAGNTIYVRTTQ